MSASAHPGDALQDFLDGRLSGVAAEQVRAHLETCASCQAVRDELTIAREALATLRGGDIPLPVDLLAAVQRSLAAESAPRPAPAAMPSNHVRASGADSRRRRWFAVAAAAAVVIGYVLLGNRPTPLDLPAQAARDLGAVGSRTLPLELRTDQAALLERYFAATPNGPRVRVIDLAMMSIALEGGVRHTLDGRQSALYSYRTPSGARLVCQMFEGRLADLPAPGEVREQNGFRFQVYTRGAVTLVFWQEGELVCVLASELPANEVIALAVAKAMAPA